MKRVRPKKRLGQHFLKDNSIAKRVADAICADNCDAVLEVGPGTGVLTKYILERRFENFSVVEIDRESVSYLKDNFKGLNIIQADFFSLDINNLYPGTLAIVGNFPYNISGPLLFRVLEYRDRILELTGMFQHEVALRICSPPGSRVYGILSVLLQAYYNIEYLFSVPPHVFYPEPKVKSGVIRLRRNNATRLDCNEELFLRVVKSSFGHRRKMLRNSIKSAFNISSEECPFFRLRPEQLSVEQFVELTRWISDKMVSE